MWAKIFGSLDLGKLSLGTVPGFIASAAILLLVDALGSGQLIAGFWTDLSAGKLAVEAVIVFVGSAIFGTVVNNIFHTFGRWYAGKIWRNLHRIFQYRTCLMENLGLSKFEFEWIQSKDENKANEVEENYMPYTETAGSAAYAIILLGIGLSFFVFKQNQSFVEVLIVGVTCGLLSIILLLTSAASLAKYETNKTMSAMDEIRSMSSHNCLAPRDVSQYPVRPLGHLCLLLVPCVIIGVSAVCVYVPGINNHLQSDNNIRVISYLTSDSIVPVMDINVANSTITYNTSYIIALNGKYGDLKIVDSNWGNKEMSANLVAYDGLEPGPNFSLTMTVLEKTSENSLAFNLKYELTDPAKPVNGNWLFPIYMKETGNEAKYLLEYVRVTVPDTTK
jgi:hypothetical protein